MNQGPAGIEAPVTQVKREKLFTANFLLAAFVTLAAFSSFYLLLATLPVYVTKEINGTESDVGLVMGIFSASAVMLRLWVGKVADERGRKPLILVGTMGLAVCSLLYIFATTVPSLLALRLVHALGWASFGTATSALVADLAPRARRGAAMGYYGMFNNLAMAVGPAAGIALMNAFSFDTLFVTASAIAIVAIMLVLPIREPQTEGPSRSTGTTQGKGGIIERTSLFPALVLTLMAVTYGSIVTFVPLYAAKNGVANPGMFFTVYAVTLIASRGFTGQLSDQFGRAAVIAPGLGLAAVGLWVLSTATALPLFLFVAVLYGLAFALVQPALMALVVDRAPVHRRGAAMGTFSSAMDLGIGGGSIVWGFVAQAVGYGGMYVGSGVVALAALGVFLIGSRTYQSGSAAVPRQGR